MTRPCAVCGSPFDGNSRRLYCSGACRARAARERETKTLATAVFSTEAGAVEDAVRLTLTEDELATVAGESALALARHVDSPKSSATGASTAAKQLVLLVDAVEKARLQHGESVLDRLRSQRIIRRGDPEYVERKAEG